MELKPCVSFSQDAEKQTACLNRAKESAFALSPPAGLTLTANRLIFRGFGYGRSAPVFYRNASPLSICLEDVLRFGPANCRRLSLLAAAALFFFGTLACLFAFPGLPLLWRALLFINLALLSPAILLVLFWRWPASFFCIQYRGGCLRLPLRWYAPPELQAFQSALNQALLRQKALKTGNQAALTLAQATALYEYALLRQQGLLTEEEFCQAKAQVLCLTGWKP